MANYSSAKAKAEELTIYSLVEIAEMIIDLENKVESLEDDVASLSRELDQRD